MENDEDIRVVLKKQLKRYITDILKLEKDSTGKYQCISGQHADMSPSMGFVPNNEELLHCFACNSNFNIFHVANLTQNLPISGEEFWSITIPTLCAQLNIKYEVKELTPEQKDRMLRYDICESIREIIFNTDTPLLTSYLVMRNIDKSIAKLYNIGVIESFKIYKEQLLKKGYNEDFLKKNGYLDEKLFTEHNLIFCINNDKGRTVGFVGRRMDYTEGCGFSKYYNSPNSDIYNKGNILYNFDKAKNHTPPLLICEGYIDVISCCANGYPNAVALGSTAFTDSTYFSHVTLLQKYAIKDIILCFDSDDAGRKNLNKTIEILSKYPEFRISILQLPTIDNEKVDLDSFLQNYGPKSLEKIKSKSLFEYKLDNYSYNDDSEKIAKEMIPYISNNESKITHYVMAELLSKRTGVPLDVILKEIDANIDAKDYKSFQELNKNKKRLTKLIDSATNTTELKLIVDKAINDIKDNNNVQLNDKEIYKQRLLEYKNNLREKKDNLFSLGKFSYLDKALEGIPKGACYIALPAIPNIGKSSFVRHLTYEMVNANPNLVVLMFSIDDSFEKVIPAYIAIESKLSISEIRKPYKYIIPIQDKNKKEEKKRRLASGWDKVESLYERLIVKDLKDNIGTTAEIKKYIESYKKSMPDKEFLVVIDNFHNLKDFPGEDNRIKFQNISDIIKGMTITYNIPIINIMELKKRERYDSRPNPNDIKECGDIEYDADIIMFLHQELHFAKDDTDMFWYSNNEGFDYENQRIKFPINELIIYKTKESGYKGSLFFRFRSDKATFYEIKFNQIQKSNNESVFYND